MISAYTTAFNFEHMNMPLKDALSNWFVYCDEVVISTIDKDREEAEKQVADFSLANKIKIVSLDIDTDDLFWDGKLKNNGLKNCSHDVVFQIDLDERISGDTGHLNKLAEVIEQSTESCSISIHNIDLFGDLNHYKSIGRKWYLHSRKGCYRGAVNFAIIDDKIFDPEKSDTCELIDKDGNLIPCMGVASLTPNSVKVFHLGFLDLDRRANLNESFWKDIWSERKSLSQNKKVEAKDVLVNTIDFETIEKYELQFPQPLWPTIE
tara:strand:+ start:929 stop:1720 length:792 start_codon:yes stop_codon:yes gene_type:complete